MDLLEYQGKQFFATFGIPVSDGRAVDTVDEAVAAADAVGYPVVVKAQVHVGGRGKAGGVKLANDADEVPRARRQHPRARHQGPRRQDRVDRARLGHRRGVLRQLHARPCRQEAPRHALGRGRRRDRDRGRVEPRRHRQDLDRPGRRAHPRGRPRAGSLAAKLNPAATDGAVDILTKLYTAYVDGDADLCEINPLILTPDGRVHALDAKVTLDDNAEFRHEWGDYDAHPGARRARAGRPRQGPAVRRPRRLRRHHRQRRRAGHEHRSTSSTRSAARPPTSSTSAAAPTPTSWPVRSRSSTTTPA